MDGVHEKIITILSEEKSSLKIKDIAFKCGLNPHTVARKLDTLELIGRVRKIQVGNAKKYFLIDSVPINGLIDISSDLILIIDHRLVVQYINKSAQELFELNDKQIIGERLDLLNLEIFSFREVLDGLKHFSSRKVSRIEVSIERDSVRKWYEVSVIKFALRIGSVSVALIAEDITEKKKTHQLLIESESRYRHLFEFAPVPIHEEDYSGVKEMLDSLTMSGITDLKRYFDLHPEIVTECISKVRILKMNKKSRELFKISSSDLCEVSNNIFLNLTEESLEQIKLNLISINEGKIPDKYQLSTEIKGNHYFFSIHMDRCSSTETDFKRVYASYLNITSQIQLQQELLKKQGEIIEVTEEVILQERILKTKVMDFEEELVIVKGMNSILKQLIDTSKIPVIFWDSKGTILWMSSAAVHLTGKKIDDKSCLSLGSLFPESSRRTSIHNIESLLKSEKMRAIKIPILDSNGDVKDVMMSFLHDKFNYGVSFTSGKFLEIEEYPEESIPFQDDIS